MWILSTGVNVHNGQGRLVSLMLLVGPHPSRPPSIHPFSGVRLFCGRGQQH